MTAPIAIDLSPCAGSSTGVGRYVSDLTRGLADLGAAFCGVYQGHHGPPAASVVARCLGVRRYDLLGGRIGALVRLPSALSSLGCDLYHTTSTIAVPGPGWGGRMVATVHDCWPLAEGAGVPPRVKRLFRSLLHSIFARSEAVITPSSASADEVRSAGWNGRLEVIPHGIAAAPAAPRPPSAPDGPYVLTIGAIEPRKGLQHLAAARCSAPWIHLGPLRHDPLGLIQAQLDAAGCRRLGYVTEAERAGWLAHAAILAMPSATEGFGYPALEAMAAGVPVVAFANGALPEVLGDAAVWSTPDLLADDMRRLLADEYERLERSAAGRSRAASFTILRMARTHSALYRELAR